ncbi:hypothetical protein LWC33_04480 [Pseudonocardia sp. RS11V-5]|uniref:hypothetical protein n=1 Tax=Pseudonocardia terrae TaxID=2905831 RepID=UPI001E64BBDB|nr:hypothetical protein [Pseudonocardia terrae]MCE3550711.1 hypothetical protein [Pseudonocardia terrae]
MILEGGSAVAGVSLVAYGVFSAVLSLVTWRVLLRMGSDRPLVEAEEVPTARLQRWFADLVFVVAGFVLIQVAVGGSG